MCSVKKMMKITKDFLYNAAKIFPFNRQQYRLSRRENENSNDKKQQILGQCLFA